MSIEQIETALADDLWHNRNATAAGKITQLIRAVIAAAAKPDPGDVPEWWREGWACGADYMPMWKKAESELARRVEAATAEAQQHVSRCHEQINELAAATADKDARIEKLERIISAKDSDHDAAVEECNRLRQQLAETATTWNARVIANADAAVQKVAAELAASQAECNRITAANVKYHNSSIDAENEIEKLRAQLAAAQAESERLKRELTSKSAARDSMENNCNEWRKLAKASADEIATLRAQLAAYRAEKGKVAT